MALNSLCGRVRRIGAGAHAACRDASTMRLALSGIAPSAASAKADKPFPHQE